MLKIGCVTADGTRTESFPMPTTTNRTARKSRAIGIGPDAPGESFVNERRTSQIVALRHWARLAGAYATRTVVSSLAKIAIGAMLTAWLDRDVLMLWILATSLGTVTAQVLDGGFQHRVIRATTLKSHGESDRRDHAKPLLRLILGLSVPATASALMLARIAHRFWLPSGGLDLSSVSFVFVVAVWGAMAQMTAHTLSAYLIGDERPWLAVSTTGVATLAWACTAGICAALDVPITTLAVLAQLPYVAACWTVWRLLKRSTDRRRPTDPSVTQREETKAEIRTADVVPFWLFNLAGLVISGIDLYWVAAFDANRVAGYAYAVQAAAVCALIAAAIGTPLVAHVSRQSGAGRGVTTAPLMKVNILVIGVSTLYAGLGTLWFEHAGELWLGDVGPDAAIVFVPLVLASAMRSVLIPTILSIVGSGNQRVLVRPAILEAVVNAVASAILGSRFGAPGVAVASVLGTVAAAVDFGTTTRRWGVADDQRKPLLRQALAGSCGASAIILICSFFARVDHKVLGTLALATFLIVWAGRTQAIPIFGRQAK